LKYENHEEVKNSHEDHKNFLNKLKNDHKIEIANLKEKFNLEFNNLKEKLKSLDPKNSIDEQKKFENLLYLSLFFSPIKNKKK
jgi:hypothetical protein